MTTNFFQNINAMNVPGNWKLTVHTDEQGQFTVSALFTALHNADNATKAIPPMLFKGTATELDEGFFEAITQPVQQTAGLYHNLNAYHKELEKARVASKMEQDKKNKNNSKPKPATGETDENIELREPQPNKEEKRKAYVQTMIKINELNAACKYEEAIAILPSATDYPEKEAELKTKLADLTRKRDQMAQALSLFNA
ncbi:PRTRC system protein E [Mucilaginibacter rubeus]|uniref:PRTRC system protein E n=1 Tax=Mucilaginibacter rubeus TaxID=2027860 RepID=A0AAE6JLU3_9SPHI|nr:MULTISPECIES: PRTRC system protein E [Mucilaginibacter]NHA05588.1 PRTRC system protein E [Mucilaginibacter inviolabilis]QEM07095.1 PRTRC system protein E [Mucilaginibacter rubeus]QTE35396.1 PRTRC system protein E [Mucilaginibacter gossypii]QTE43763.1 PRTRC system protein E [Mucilaginibacter rubeus]QTE50362.1 PRTRC system protein E [Mucilaginibacter rubeus]